MKKNISVSFIILSILFLFYLGINLLSPRTTDDYDFANHLVTHERLSSFMDILNNMVTQYMHMNGRVFTHFPIFLFCSLQIDWLFDVINALAYILFIVVSLRYINRIGGFTSSIQRLVALIIAYWFLLPVPGETVFWITGSFNYLWVAWGMLLFLSVFHYLEKQSINKLWYALWIPFSFICGWSLEATSVAVSMAIAIYTYHHRAHFSKRLFNLIIPFWIGTLFVCLSPGIIDRFWSSTSNQSWELSIASRIYTLYHFFIHAKVSVLLGIGLVYMFMKKKEFLKSWYHKYELLYNAWIASLLFLWIIGYNDTIRGLFWSETCAILLGFSLIFSFKKKISISVVNGILVLASIGMVIEMGMVWQKWEKVHEGAQQMITDYLASEDGIVRNPIHPNDLDSRHIYWVSYPNNWQVGEYYHRPYDMTMIPGEVYDAMHGMGEFFIPAHETLKGAYTLPNYLSYFIPLPEDEHRSWIPVHYQYELDESFLPFKDMLYPLYIKVQEYYNHIMPRRCVVTVNGRKYLIMNKIKRVPWFLNLNGIEIH